MIHSRKLVAWFLMMAACHGTAQPLPSSVPAEGASVSLAFTAALSSRTAAVGDPVGFVLAEDLKVNGVVVARAGSPASGRVLHVKRAALAGQSGSIGLHLNDLSLGKDQVELWGVKESAGSEAVLSRPYHLKWPMGLLRSGDDIEVKAGTLLTAFVGRKRAIPESHER